MVLAQLPLLCGAPWGGRGTESLVTGAGQADPRHAVASQSSVGPALWLGALGGAGPRERVGLVALYPWLYGLPGALWRLSGLLVAQSSLQNRG